MYSIARKSNVLGCFRYFLHRLRRRAQLALV